MKLDSTTVRTLEKLLSEELAHCDEYIKALDRERTSVLKLEADAITTLAARRNDLCEMIEVARTKRTEFVAKVSGSSAMSVTELVNASASPSDRKRILALVGKIKQRVAQIEGSSKEFSQIVNFSLGLVNGSLSILWSATETVTKCYNSFGGVTEMIQPAAPRVGSLLGKA